MELIIGGAYQGKLSWAVAHYGLREDEICDLAADMPIPGKRCYCHLEALTKRDPDCASYLPLFRDAIVIAREIGSGVVPLDADARAWRERHGSLLRRLAADADRVTRIFCGLPEVLK
ncbi:MAG: bifunctional adenosylcobinamide kinase/adenosylcobinamide-phosphate guanylyltransferase [Oscillospiraceae bacterium]|nr:bifunctional adenosylcobinamide kinase/adenosylcobinamide-phosphate guanylyltransferase [Oscillospiraceae bacterium]